MTNITLEERARKLVENEVLCCISGLAEKCFEKSIFSWDEFENLYNYNCPECGHQEINNEAFDNGKFEDNHPCYKCPFCKKELRELPEDNQAKEVFEYWLVTEWLYIKLKDKGEPVYSYDDFNFIWGRTTTGQAIYADYVIEKITEELMK